MNGPRFENASLDFHVKNIPDTKPFEKSKGFLI